MELVCLAEFKDSILIFARYGRGVRAVSGSRFLNHGSEQRFIYDPAGNLITHVTGNGHSIQMAYDAAGRLIRRVVPAVSYGQGRCDFDGDLGVPCLPGLHFDARVIPADTVTFRYDAAGRLVEARNRNSSVKRSYYPGGLLSTDSLVLSKYDTTIAGNGHVFGLTYTYDRNGRKTATNYSSGFGTASTTYTYATWGALQNVNGPSGSYAYAYDALGRVESITYPSGTGLIERFAYDYDGRRVRRQLGTASSPGSIYDDTLTFEARGKVKRVQIRSSAREAEYWYSGLGHVAAARWQSTNTSDYQIDEFRYDAHGNTYWTRKRDPFNSAENAPVYNTYYDGFGRIERMIAQDLLLRGGTNSWRTFDIAGNLSYATEIPHSMGSGGGETRRGITRYYYAADGKLVHLQRIDRATDGTINIQDLKEETWYDALGRRVLVATDSWQGPDVITRFVWDGDQIIAEARTPLSTPDTPAGTGWVYYVHGSDLDAPLGVLRSGSGLLVPFTNWRGQFERGFLLGGSCTGFNCLAVDWPAPELRTRLDGSVSGNGTWVGSLIEDQRGETGLLYRRNRYYDPQTGQFTQQDPIGLAGGLNLYGFANGDPVSYTDPFGLCPEDRGGDGKTDRLDDCPRGSEGWNEHREQERARVEACYENNRFSSLFGDGAIRAGVEVVEIGSLISVGTDLAAIAIKGGGSLGTKNVYASGFNMIGRAIARNAGRRDLIGAVTKVGDKVTPVLAVIGVGTAAYNITTDVQCRLGLIQ